jgi:thioredoxin reductase/NAD-dependent dihydropyrimidine dehydrogenase PreA subunit
MEILTHVRFILAAITIFLVVIVGLPFIFKEIRKKRRAGELAERIIPLSSLTEADIEKIRSLHPAGKKTYPAVNRAACIGCGTCVQNCREKTVLAIIRGKSTIVNPLACRCCGECEQSCLTGALKIVEHGKKIKIRVPWTDENQQSNVEGIYIVGSLTGAGLIKEAINQGRTAVNHIVKGAAPPSLPSVLVVGAGPAGLSAMLSCRKFGLPVLCFEKDLSANTIRNFPKKKILMAEPVEMPIVGPLWVGDTSREKLLDAWEKMLIKAGARITTNAQLEKIEKKDGQFRVTISGKHYSGDQVILALGNRGVPRKIGIRGEDGPNVFYNLLEADEFSGSAVTIIGAGDSAIEAALALERNGCRVTMLVRGDGFPKAKEKNQERIRQVDARGHVQVHFNSQPIEIGADFISFTAGGETRREKNDAVFIMVGGELPFELLQSFGIRIVEKEI